MPSFPKGGGASGTQIPAPNSVPESDSVGQIAAGWMPPAVFENERYVSPDGDDDDVGDGWDRPLKYLTTAWAQLYALGGGTIYFADETEILDTLAPGFNGLYILGNGDVLPAGGVRAMPVRVIGCPSVSSRGFAYSAPARLYGGAVDPGTDQDDPGLWISGAIGSPMFFSNIRFQDGLNKVMRIGMDYQRNDSGVIIKNDITHAARAAGSTTFTTDPYEFDICKISRVDDVVTVVIKIRPTINQVILTGMSVHVDFTGPDFTPVTAVVTGVTSDGQANNAFTIASIGDDFSTGTAPQGATIGTAESNLALVDDTITTYVGVSEFPASRYKITAFNQTSITVTDVYGYAPRSATASADDIGTYAVMNRLSFPAARLAMDNICGSPQLDDAATERFCSGPSVEIGNLEFFRFANFFVDGFNIATVGGEYGCRDGDRRCSLLMDGGGYTAVTGFGTFKNIVNSYGGIRYYASPNATSICEIDEVIIDLPISGYKAVEAVEVLGTGSSEVLRLKNISLVDHPGDIATVKIGTGLSWNVVVVDGVFGKISGACNMVSGGTPNVVSTLSTTPNKEGQTGYYGQERLIAGKHQGAARAGAACSSPLIGGWISEDPDDWTSIDAGITVTEGVRDPFGGMTAVRLTSNADGQQAVFYANNLTGVPSAGDIGAIAAWLRSSSATDAPFTLAVRNGDADEVYLSVGGSLPDRAGEWNTVVAGGELTGSPANGDTYYVVTLTLNDGDEIDVYCPQLFRLRNSDRDGVNDSELAEILTNIQPRPYYMAYPGVPGTYQGQKFIAHGGVGTDGTNTKVVGAGAGELTLTGTGTVYLPIYDDDGTTILGWTALLQATVNP